MSDSQLGKIVIPEHVTVEVKRLHLDLVAKARTYEAARVAFGEYMRATKKALAVPEDTAQRFWDITDDASTFEERAR